jgi:outer membrane beta-barrel protein
MKSHSRGLPLAVVLLALVPAAVKAAEPERVVVRNRKFTTDGRFEASLSVGFTMVNFLTEHTNFRGAFSYNLAETLALELGGGYALNRTTNVAEAASNEVVQSEPSSAQKIASDFEDLWRMNWGADAALRWAPIYGKLNIAAEVPVHFQAYLLVGGGASGMVRDSLVYCIGAPSSRKNAVCTTKEPADVSKANILTPLRDAKLKPVFMTGVGFRFFLVDWLGVRLEVRDHAFPDSFRVRIQRKEAEGDVGARDGGESAAKFGEQAASPGFTHLVFMNTAVSFLF